LFRHPPPTPAKPSRSCSSLIYMASIYRGEWPRESRPRWYNSLAAPTGIPVLSLTGAVRGITLGGGAPCPSRECPGTFICVDWETGHCLFPCSEGWEYRTDPIPHYRIVAGGEITGRVINPVKVPPRSSWPHRRLTVDIDWPEALLLGA